MRRLAVAALVLAALGLAAWAIVVGVAASLPQPGDLATRAPVLTQLMRDRAREADRQGRRYRIQRQWVSYDAISPTLRHAVLIAEDDAFFSHDGLDWNEIEHSARTNLRAGRIVRGGSTITQQLARNLWLGEERTLTRKLAEMILALRLERALSKRRIFELYLNEIEWGDGVYGVEAAARRWFGVSAASLTPRQAAALAAVIINPRRFSPVAPSSRIERRMRMILDRMHRRGELDDEAYAEAIQAPQPNRPPLLLRWFGFGRHDTTAADTVVTDSAATESLSPPGTP